jgi:hypothetical protein
LELIYIQSKIDKLLLFLELLLLLLHKLLLLLFKLPNYPPDPESIMAGKPDLQTKDLVSNNVLFIFRIFFYEMFLYILIINIIKKIQP